MPAGAPRRKPSVPAAPPDIPADFSALTPERHVALAVSGGSDSTALMRLAADWARTNHPGLVLSVLTVDHGLRPAAAAEARQVGQWATALGLGHQVLRWTEDPKPATGLQARAREARYGLMAQWCQAQGATALLTAHTLDDQAETVLMRLARTTSPDSLAGIRPAGGWQGLPLLRPLLGVKRQALRDWLASLGQPWIDDPSNEDPRFERVRARRSLAAMGPETTARLAALAEAAARATDLLARTARKWLAFSLQEHEAGICHIAAGDFRDLPAALQERILAIVIAHYGGGQGAVDADELRRIARWACSGEGPVRCTLGGALLGRRKTGFWVTREAGRIAASPQRVPGDGKLLWDNRFLVEAVPGSTVAPVAARKLPPLAGVPVYAQRAGPWVEPPPGAPPARIRFLRLNTQR
ncbi:tRNA lysidine(34) synthetase TilS [Aestuariivirga litoralis]|uniref:tRNA(Ile)-lysidine synthase n=1 Tax=Aestuariivirga litoralis TaxID=2650924 RepID=A0A2W2BQQ6_9HYPH|nr:tRNA lysidine(34) synthetase TilS [Aestuariivirga litoralis]